MADLRDPMLGSLTGEQQSLGDVLEQVAVWLKQSRSVGVSATSLSVLNRLSESGPLRITVLASREGVSQPAMTTLIDRLEERGWATRGVDPADRRATLVAVTTVGGRFIAAHRRARREIVGDRVAALSAADQRSLVAALPALRRLMDSPSPARNEPARPGERQRQQESARVDA